jgi:hypothetical protein
MSGLARVSCYLGLQPWEHLGLGNQSKSEAAEELDHRVFADQVDWTLVRFQHPPDHFPADAAGAPSAGDCQAGQFVETRVGLEPDAPDYPLFRVPGDHELVRLQAFQIAANRSHHILDLLDV